MICEDCKDHRHEECQGGSWCDCQHKPPTGQEQESGDSEQDGDRAPEPPTNWLRQG
ncbi:hypothetical protein Sru01_55690 [Sphaerisporangium rufum]|uniref:Uncharacterized protein n=1 Tax=Sphaerisporangium rufum TaxID=1381558 RepID=A0A919RAX1_9ACTN|nr:hypothetical protein [Sphaerisporangium rufum]GII80587.1 hypothetical protein Sru01_55690 [Sphaerisporangium rufum]